MTSIHTVTMMAKVALVVLLAVSVAQAGVIRIAETDFLAGSGLITFSEFPLGTTNPTYLPADYGGGPGSPTVTFEGFFSGQALGGASPPCPPGAALSGCVIGSPTNPLTLDSAAPNTFITTDGANPTSPVLSGTPTFNGPIAILFDVDVAGVGLDAGFFDAVGGTAIIVYARDGSVLGSVSNLGLGIEFLGLVTDDGTEQIAGLLFALVGAEPAGFAIDNVRFGQQGEVRVPSEVPEPGTITLLGAGLVGLILSRRRARRGSPPHHA